MEKIIFVNNSQPALNAANLNGLQDNIEDGIDDIVSIKTNTTGYIEDALKYRTFNKVIDGNYSQEVTTGKNKLKVTNLELLKSLNTIGTWNGNAYTHNGITYTVNDDKSILANGTATGSSYMILVEDLNNLTSGTNYILSGCPQDGGVSKYAVRLYKSDNTYSSEIGLELGFAFSNQTYVRINIFSGITANNLLFKPMIRLATIADNTYESYTGEQPSPSPDYPQEIKVIKDSIELKVTSGNNIDTYTIDLQDEFLCKLPNGVKDELHIDKHGNVTLVKKIGKIIFDGSETDWYYNSSRGGFSTNNMIGTPVSPYMLSNNFICENSYTTWTSEGKFGVSSSGTLWFKTLIASSVPSFKTWLSTHNTGIYYELETPYTVNLGNIGEIATYKGINNIEVISNLDTTFSVEYAQDLQKKIEELINAIVSLGGNL